MSSSFLASYIVIWLLVVFQGLLVLALLRQLAELRRLVESGSLQDENRLPVGSLAPEFAGSDVRSGERVSIQSLGGRGGVILFLSAECSVCKDLADSLQQPAINELPPIIAFCQGGEQTCARIAKRMGSEVRLIFEGAAETAERYHAFGLPTAIVVDGERKIRGHGHPQEVEDIRRLLSRSLDADSADAGRVEQSQPAVLGSRVSR